MLPNPLTEDNKNYIRSYHDKKRVAELAKITRVPPSAISRFMNKENLSGMPKRYRYDPGKMEKIKHRQRTEAGIFNVHEQKNWLSGYNA